METPDGMAGTAPGPAAGPASRDDLAVGAAFFAAVFGAATFRISTFDVWWHLATGRWILAGHGVPRADPFSFTAAGNEWIDHEWLFQCLLYAVHRVGGAPGLIVLKAALVAAAATLVFAFVRRRTGLPAGIVAFGVLFFVLAGRNRFVVRPELFTVLFAVLLASALYRRRERPAGWRELIRVPPMFALWANLHGGVIVGVAILALFTAGRAIEALLGRWRGLPVAASVPLPTALGLTLASAAAGLVNPFVHRVYEVPFRLTALIEDGPFRNAEWTPPRPGAHWLFFAAVAIAAVAVLARRRRPVWPALLPLLFVAAISLRYVRNLALFGFLAPVLLAACCWPADGGVPGRWSAALARSVRPAVAMVLLLALGAALALTGGGFAPGLGVDGDRLPVAAVDFLAAAHPPGHLLNAYAFGGYAIWRLFPGERTFIDGRNEVFAELRAELAAAVIDSRLWFDLLEKYSIGHTLLGYIDRPERVTVIDPAGGSPRLELRPYAVNHFPPEQWALVYWDDTAMVHVRRTPEAAALIERHESAVQPEDSGYLLERLARGEADPAAVERELLARARHGPGARRAAGLLAALHEAQAGAG